MFNPSRKAPFVLLSTDHGTMIVNQLDWERAGGDGGAGGDGVIGVSVELFNFSHYDDCTLELLGKFLEIRRELAGDGVVAIDGGANIGTYTLSLARLMAGWGSVIAIEPQDWTFRALAGATAINNCFNTKVINAALGATRGSVMVPQHDQTQPRNFGGVSLIGEKRGEGEEVELIAVDDFHLPRLDLLKLDIEGMELDALEGARRTLELCRPIVCAEHIICGMNALEKMLAPLGYSLQMVGMNAVGLHKSDPVSTRVRWYDSRAA